MDSDSISTIENSITISLTDTLQNTMNDWSTISIHDSNAAITNGNIGSLWDYTGRSSSGQLTLDGENADIVVNGESLMSMIQGIQERLNILKPNQHLEAEWDQLRELGDAYRKLESELLEKQRMWEALKK